MIKYINYRNCLDVYEILEKDNERMYIVNNDNCLTIEEKRPYIRLLSEIFGNSFSVSKECYDNIEQLVTYLLQELKDREREIIILRFGLRDGYLRTLEEVAKIFETNRERVRQIEAKAIRKLRNPVRSMYFKRSLEYFKLCKNNEEENCVNWSLKRNKIRKILINDIKDYIVNKDYTIYLENIMEKNNIKLVVDEEGSEFLPIYSDENIIDEENYWKISVISDKENVIYKYRGCDLDNLTKSIFYDLFRDHSRILIYNIFSWKLTTYLLQKGIMYTDNLLEEKQKIIEDLEEDDKNNILIELKSYYKKKELRDYIPRQIYFVKITKRLALILKKNNITTFEELKKINEKLDDEELHSACKNMEEMKMD